MIQDLTTGDSGRVLLGYTVPMFISVAFQQIYNIADSMIAGRFAGEDALAAVGASYPITMIFMAVAIGCNIGCSVIISQLFGARHYRQLKTAVSTVMLVGFVLSVLLTVTGLATTPMMMRAIQTPDNIFADGALYLRIYIGGFVFLFLYNVVTGMFNSLGDSRTPLFFLIGSSLGNIVLDLLFVAVFHRGVAGVAWATFIAQGAACVLALITFRVRLREIDSLMGENGERAEKIPIFSGNMLAKIAMVAVPSILQQSFVSVGNIFIQSLVNSYGSDVIAGYSAAVKLNTFVITGFTTFGNGVSGFVAQNLGAGRMRRVREGFRAGMKIALGVSVCFAALYFGAGGLMMRLFLENTTGTAMRTGLLFLRILSPFYIVVSMKLIADGVLRGAEAMRYFMVSTFTDLVLRVILAYLLSTRFAATGIWMSWPVGWSVATALSLLFYRRVTEKIEEGTASQK